MDYSEYISSYKYVSSFQYMSSNMPCCFVLSFIRRDNIQNVSGEIVNSLGSGSMDYSEYISSYKYVCPVFNICVFEYALLLCIVIYQTR
jgi:hypothetical protein